MLRDAQRSSFKPLHWSQGSLIDADLIPKAVTEEVPILVTGSSRQSLEWIAGNAHGWSTYPRPPATQKTLIDSWRGHVRNQAGETFKPFVQSLYLDLTERPDTPPSPIHLGLRMGRDHLIAYLELLQTMGVNHVSFNLRFGSRPVPVVLDELHRHVLPLFPPHTPANIDGVTRTIRPRDTLEDPGDDRQGPGDRRISYVDEAGLGADGALGCEA